VLAAESGGEEGGFHAPTLAEFFPEAVAFAGTPFELNRVMLIRLLAMAVLVGLFLLYAARAKVVPSRATGVGDVALDFVRVNIAQEILGEKEGRRFLPLLTTIFFMVLALNITGVIPLLNIAGTSVVGVPLVLAIVAWVVFNYVGVKAQGLGPYLKSNLFPPGIPAPLYLLVTPIEFISTFVLRPVTLTVRLLANMLAGHLLLVLFFAATSYLLFEASAALKVFSVVTFAMGFAFTLFEILVAFLQAYIFALLTAVYISGALHAEH
jgi:F-type H+-transporting ATPase subunit a